jgi:hypothetical protein
MKESTEPSAGTPLPWWRDPQSRSNELETACSRPLRRGDTCPQCHKGVIDYNGLFQLACPRCGAVVEGGAFS